MIKKTLLPILLLTAFLANGQSRWSSIARSGMIFARGLSGPVYRTDSDLKVIDINTGDTTIIEAGLQYRKMDQEDGDLYLKVLSGVVTTGNRVKLNLGSSDLSDQTHEKLFKVQESSLKSYNQVWQQGLSWSTLILPVKYRPATNFNGTQFERTFSTDISVGPFIGYKFKVGEFYDQFGQVGAFAGPSLIQFPATVNPNNGSTDQNNISNDNLIGYSYGFGAVYQFDNLQIGIIYGNDKLGGEKSKEWQYDNEWWWSFAVGYKFLD